MLRRRAFLLSPALLVAAPAEAFNGRWNLRPEREPRGRAWWLKVENAGTPQIRGEFVGFPGGQLDPIPEIALEGDTLVWKSKDRTYSAQRDGDSLIGLLTASDGTVRFTGRRAPVLRDKDDGSWRPGIPIQLFNGRDLAGWQPIVPLETMNWTVERGILKNGQKAINIQTEAHFFNFRLQVEFRVANESNSGLGLRARYEVQIFGDHGQPPSLHGNGALYSRRAPNVNATLPPAQWQTFDITLIGRDLTVVLNGKTLHDKVEVEGLTAMATDPDESAPGPLSLQGDHGPVEFRRITLTPLRQV
jgi:hypothetical protein